MAAIQREHTAKGKPKLIVTDPEYTISIVGLVASFSQPLLGIILSSIALKRSKLAGRQNTYALIGFILGIVLMALLVIFLTLYAIVFVLIIAAQGHRG